MKNIKCFCLQECAHRFPVPLYGNEGKKVDKFVLTAVPEQLKCIVTLTGDSITNAVRNLIQYLFYKPSGLNQVLIFIGH